MDLLADVLAVAGVRSVLGARIEASGRWSAAWSSVRGASFYAIGSGVAWLTPADGSLRQLMPGDVVLLPDGGSHMLASAPDASDAVVRARDCVVAERARSDGEVLRLGSGEVETHILGATYEYDRTVSIPILAMLPAVLHIRADNSGTSLDDTVRLLCRELASPQLATGVVLNRLVDIVLIQLIRAWLASEPDAIQGTWLGVLHDPVVSAAMTKLHSDPGRQWTADALAAELDISRTTLARRFRDVAGEAPGAYLTRWRMDLAAIRLRDSNDTLDTISRSVGYTSVYAFSRAFRRSRGQAPGRYRSLSRAS